MRQADVQAPRTKLPGASQVVSQARLSSWHEPPPPSPILLERLKAIRWERSIFALGAVASLAIMATVNKDAGFLAMAIVSFGQIVWEKWLYSQRTSAQVVHLLDVPSTLDQFPVEITLAANGRVYESDAGVVTFDGSWLNYQGLRTSFNLNGAQEALRKVQPGFEFPRALVEENLVVCYRIQQVDFKLTITPFDRMPGRIHCRRRFRAATEFWLRETREAARSLILQQPVSSVMAKLRELSDYFVTASPGFSAAEREGCDVELTSLLPPVSLACKSIQLRTGAPRRTFIFIAVSVLTPVFSVYLLWGDLSQGLPWLVVVFLSSLLMLFAAPKFVNSKSQMRIAPTLLDLETDSRVAVIFSQVPAPRKRRLSAGTDNPYSGIERF